MPDALRLVEISDPDDPRLADYRDLRDVELRKSLEAEHGLFLAEGEKVVRRSIEAGYAPRSFLMAPRWLDGLADVLALDALPAAVIGLGLNYAAYEAEIYRAGIAAVPRGEIEAAHALGMSGALTLRRVTLPQALRVALPGMANDFIGLLKDTSLVSVVLVTELLREAQIIAGQTFEYFTLYSVAAVYYWVVCFLLSIGQARLETRLSRHVAV